MDTLQKTLKNLPHSPGVYLYYDADNTVIYVGKARDLFARVHQYFIDLKQLPEKTRQLRSHIHTIQVKKVSTEFEAILLEAKLIRFYNPKYNSIAKDDKSPIYIAIQNTTHLPIVGLERKAKIASPQTQEYFGPFATRKIALRLLHTLRYSIPFCQQKVQNGKPCFYSHLGRCNPCPSAIQSIKNPSEKKSAEKNYKKNIQRLRWVLSGKSLHTLKSLQEDMILFAQKEQFEQAASVRDQIQSLMSILHTSYDPFLFESTDQLERLPFEQTEQLRLLLLPFLPLHKPLHRIECYDMSTLRGTNSVGSLVVLIDGIPHTNQYRRFKIRDQSKASDVEMMEEVIRRRMNHPEWTQPDLIIVDGGKPQVAKISSVLSSLHLSIPLVGLAKRFEQLIVPQAESFQTITLPLSNPALQLVQHIRDEAHRFAHSYHTKLRKRAFAQTASSLV